MAVETKREINIADYKELKPLAEALMEEWLVPGVTVGILRNGEVELHAFGVESIQTDFPMRADTLLQIGSISKVFTATLIMRLVEEGKLDLDTPIRTYLPDLKLESESALEKITLRHTLTHTSGVLGDFFDDFGQGDDALSKAIEQYHTLRQMFEPDELWSYCNSGFNLAGAVVEKVLDTTFEQAVRDYIFEPLGMENSTFFAAEAIVRPVAVGHTQVEPGADEIKVAEPYQLPRAVNPAGGIISTVEDLLKFAAFHIDEGKVGDEQLMKPESVLAMQEEQVKAANFSEAWAIGWDLNVLDGVKVIGHGGSTNGFQARMTVVPEKGYAIAILTNGNQGWAVNNPIAQWGLLHHCGLEYPKLEHVELTEEQLQRVAGKYTSRNSETTVTVEDGGIRLDTISKGIRGDESTEMPPVWAKPISELEFVVTTGASAGTRIDLITNEDGSLRFLRAGGRLSDRVD